MPRLLVCGAINWDTTLFVENLPKPGEEIKVERMISVPGGKGANTAVAAARILGRDQVAIAGMLGSDKIASDQLAILKDEGIDISSVSQHSESPSGQAYVVVDRKGENMVLTHRAANKEITRQTVRSANLIRAVEESAMVVIIDPPLDAAMELAAQANDHGKALIVSPAMLVYHGFSKISDLLSRAEYVIVNEHEASLLCSKDNGVEACEKLSELLGGKSVLTTLGKRGSVMIQAGKKYVLPSIDPTLFGYTVKSTVGAGDTLLGAFAAFKVKGSDDIESAFLASAAAALKITKEETRGSPTDEEIRIHAESDVMRPAYDIVRNYRRSASSI